MVISVLLDGLWHKAIPFYTHFISIVSFSVGRKIEQSLWSRYLAIQFDLVDAFKIIGVPVVTVAGLKSSKILHFSSNAF